jgi:tRNA (cmo5U34)-methyltransferase
MEKDHLFACKKNRVKPFEFNKEVADVFDDMLNRSVPLYAQSIKKQAQFTVKFYQKNSNIYDLGCSHGNLGILILDQFKKTDFSMVGVDNSKPMIEKYRQRLEKYGVYGQTDLICASMEDIKFKNASVVIINLTLQFLDKKKRNDLIKKIFQGMNSNGILLLTEKIIHPSDRINNLQSKFYEKFKIENGYSKLEISQKRDALDKVLVPDTIKTHENRLLQAGFTHFDVWLKWFNFASMIAIKQ